MATTVPPQAAAHTPKMTPVMRQYAEAKAQHPDAILFFRLGDFYEMFFDDAVLASSVLGITLTSRSKGFPEKEPMAGVPHHAAHGYIARLLGAGHKVAICEQLADPSKVKGIVPRAVVRVVTPGLVTDDDQLDARDNHFLAAIEAGAEADSPEAYGFALLDLSTGELLSGALADAALVTAEVMRSGPREILFGPGTHELAALLQPLAPGVAQRIVNAPLAAAGEILERALGAAVAADARLAHTPLSLRAAARAVEFAASCSPRFGVPVRRVGTLDVQGAMQVDEIAQQHLEIVRPASGRRDPTLLSTIDRTVTAGGARALRRRLLAPLSDVARIRERLDQVEMFVIHARVRQELRAALGATADLQRLAVKVALGQVTPRDLALLRDSLLAAPLVALAIESLPESERSLARFGSIDAMPELAKLLSEALVERPQLQDKEAGFVRDGYDAALDDARRLWRDGTALIVALEARLRDQTGAPVRVRYNSVFGWYIEVTKSQLAKVPAGWHRKQTVANGERFTNPELDQLAADIETAEDRSKELQGAIWERLVEAARGAEPRVRELARTFAEIDVAAALAEVAHQHDYVRPLVDASDVIEISDGRHPVVEQHAAKDRFVPNDTTLDLAAGRLYLVTGPNMAGKSTLMRQVALIVLLAQTGSYVPARAARIGVVDRILSRVGASDNLARGESTFMVEMRETAAILRHATRRSLVILDEIGRGTSTYDGLAIAWAVAEHLHDSVQCRALFATHYHELTELAKTARHVQNMSVSAREHDGEVIFLHTLAKGPASRSYGIAVAKLAGVPGSVLTRAKALLEELEQGEPRTPAPVATRRAEQQAASSQLGLFAAAPPPLPQDPRERAALDALRAIDVERTTPLDALAHLARLKASLAAK